MAKGFKRCPTTVATMARKLIAKHYNDLNEHDVTVDYVFAHAPVDKDGVLTGPALSRRGHPLAGEIRITPGRDRALGIADAVMTLDGDRWPKFSDALRRALLDHELAHLELKRDATEAVMVDKGGRPKLSCRHHDYELGGFHEIAERHGANSFEVLGLAPVVQRQAQLLLPFFEHKDAVA